jgi:hypothetical protein
LGWFLIGLAVLALLGLVGWLVFPSQTDPLPKFD